MTLSQFLQARLDEDETVARAASGAPWVALRGVNASQILVDPAAICDEKWRFGKLGHVASTSHAAGYADHIARHDPARVLREIEAKRRILELHTPVIDPADPWYGPDTRCSACGGYTLYAEYGGRGYRTMWPCPTLRLLARVYSDHPDYNQEEF